MTRGVFYLTRRSREVKWGLTAQKGQAKVDRRLDGFPAKSRIPRIAISTFSYLARTRSMIRATNSATVCSIRSASRKSRKHSLNCRRIPRRRSTSRHSNLPASDVIVPSSNEATTSRFSNG